VQSVIILPTDSLTLTNGTFKVTGASTLTIFSADLTTGNFRIPSTSGIWCNGGTINSASMNWTVAGLLRVSAGTFTIGNAANNVLIPKSTANITVDGGQLKLASRISNPGVAWTFTMSGGTMMIDTLSSTAAGIAPFNMDVAACSFNMSGGTLIIVRSGGSAAQNLGFNNLANSGTGFTGGTLQIGNSSTPAASVMKIATTNAIFNLTVNSANVTALVLNNLVVSGDVTLTAGTLDANNLNISVGGNWSNASAAVFTPGTATVTFNGGGPQAITGTSVAQTFNNIIVAKSTGTLLSMGVTTVTLTTNNFTQTSGDFTAPATLNINSAAASSLVITLGTFTAGANTNITGDWTKSSGSTFTHSSGTVNFTGTGAQVINGSALSQTFQNLVVAKTAGTALTVTGSTITLNLSNNLTLTTGNFTSPATFNVAGTVFINGGIFTAGANIFVGDNWSKATAATFTAGGGTVTFNGTGAQVINGTSASQTFNNVVMAKTAATSLKTGGGTSTLTVSNFTQTTGDFTAPATMNITGALLLSSGTYTAASNTNINGNWTKNSGSTFTHNSGTVTLNGSSAQNITGTSSTTFYKLVVGNASGVVLGASTTIMNNVDLSSGSLTLSDFDLSLPIGATISSAGAAHYFITKESPLTGGFLIQSVGSIAKIFPVGASASYTPVTVTNAGTVDDIRVRVFSGVYKNGTTGGLHADIAHSVNKTWLVEETVIGGSDVTLDLQWNSGDENGSFANYKCAIFHYTGGAWDFPSTFTSCTTISPGVFSRSRNTITSFSPFSIGDRFVPLPVELLSFAAKKIEKEVVLNWSTATEINNSYFAIERSLDGKSFTAIDSVTGSGNSNTLIDYSYTDMKAALESVSYYRLRQVDFDGTISYSPIQAIQPNASMTIGNIYPMPAQETINVPVEALRGGNCTADIHNLSGKLVYSETFTLGNTSQTLSIATADLLPGMYMLSIRNSNGENHSTMLIK